MLLPSEARQVFSAQQRAVTDVGLRKKIEKECQESPNANAYSVHVYKDLFG